MANRIGFATPQNPQVQRPDTDTAGRPFSRPLFYPGDSLAVTQGALPLFQGPAAVVALVRRHACGDFGALGAEDRQTNLDAIQNGARILSAYEIAGRKVYVITEAAADGHDPKIRSLTTVLLADEY